MTNTGAIPVNPPSPLRSNWDSAPIWFKWMLHEIGVREYPGPTSNPRIIAYRQMAKINIQGDDSVVPWCAIFANAALEVNGIIGTRNPAARSFENNPNFVRLPGPALGAIVTYWRVSRSSGEGHVNFYRGEIPQRIYGGGGNQGDSVTIASFPRISPSFGVTGYWWPKSVPIPVVAPIVIHAGQPLDEDNQKVD